MTPRWLRPRSSGPGRSWVGAACLAALAAVACQPSTAELREWTPADHDHQGEPGRGQVAARTADDEARENAQRGLPGLSEVAIATWRAQCISCHGVVGRGDGPQGPMVKARDLSDPAWQGSITDAAIASSIVQGKGSMPAFPLPPPTVEALVRLIRLLDVSRLQRGPAPPASGSAPAPGGSAPAPGGGVPAPGGPGGAAPAGPAAPPAASGAGR